jgi:hypothetical protein
MGLSPSWVKPDYKIGICCFSTKHAAIRRKSKDWLALNKDNVEQHMSPQTVVSVSKDYKYQIKCIGLLQRKHHYHLIQYNLFLP